MNGKITTVDGETITIEALREAAAKLPNFREAKYCRICKYVSTETRPDPEPTPESGYLVFYKCAVHGVFIDDISEELEVEHVCDDYKAKEKNDAGN